MSRSKPANPEQNNESGSGLQRGRILVVAGPSGVGKATVLSELFAICPLQIHTSVSATTRKPRPGEIDGQHYHFYTHEQFQSQRLSNGFLECFEVFGSGTWYGTPLSEVEPYLERGSWVLLEIDVQGARMVREKYGTEMISIFISPGSLEVLQQRLRGRNTETEADIAVRLRQAETEMKSAGEFDFIVVNDIAARAAAEINQIITKESCNNVQ